MNLRRHTACSTFALASALALAPTLIGCWSSRYEVIEGGNGGHAPAASSTPGADPNTVVKPECIDPSGFGGKGCFKCAPTNSAELLSACTTSHYETFENARRIAGFDPKNPRPHVPSQGPTPPPYEGSGSTTDPLPPAPPCPIDTKPNPVMMLGASGFPLETIAKAMGTEATIFYQEKGSCDGVASMVTNDPKLSGDIVYFDADGTKNRCSLAQPHPADITTSGLFAQSCANQSGLSGSVILPPDVQDYLGPVNPVMFAVPATSSERAISAEAAYRVYGFGDASGVAPWSDEELVFRRRGTSGTQQTVALSLGLPLDGLRGRDSNGASNMLKALRESPDPRRTLGISSSEIVDVNRDVMKSLAYQHFGQPVAFYPDSDPASLDRKNVRDGHYFMWIPLHVLARMRAGDPVSASNPALDPSGSKRAARDAAVKRLVLVMVNRQQAPVKSVDILGALKRIGDVPQCAMHVSRVKEGAALEPYTPPVACDCAFEAALPGTTRKECTPCESSAQCSSDRPTCSFGYCE